eukprot:scaffold45588_cov31-Tisochrysis_lutea.AAC.4
MISPLPATYLYSVDKDFNLEISDDLFRRWRGDYTYDTKSLITRGESQYSRLETSRGRWPLTGQDSARAKLALSTYSYHRYFNF